MSLRRCCILLLFAVLVGYRGLIQTNVRSTVHAADEPSEAEKKLVQERKERYTNWMRTYAEATKVSILAGRTPDQDKDVVAELVANPIFRYSDEEHLIPDATLWAWTRNGRPAAFQKVEGNNHGGGQMWTICFTSLSDQLVNVKWPMQRQFSSKVPGIAFRPIPGADAPSDNARLRTAQLKSLKDRFSARFGVKPDGTGGAESRTMPKALFEYGDPNTKLPWGAVYGMTSTGTNPSILFLIEAREDGAGKLRWEYATARMTSFSVHARLDDEDVWVEQDVPSDKFDSWTYYFLSRDFP